jgi:hypothetical protein
MKGKRSILPFAFVTLFIVSPCSATVITFDDLPLNTGTASFLPSNYQGLVWSNFGVVNGLLTPNNFSFTNGLYYGVVSVSNVALNAGGTPSEIDSPGTNFSLLSVYLTGLFRSNLNIDVRGFLGTNLLYDQTVVAKATNPTLFAFNYLNIDRLYFNSFGGDIAFGTSPGEQFVMDNFTFEFVPEPSSLLLTGAGALLLWPLLKRKRA